MAQIHFLDGTIHIQADMAPEVVFLSFCHELNHGVLQGMNHYLKNMIYHDETFVEQGAQAWAQIIKQIVDYNLTHVIEYRKEPEEEDEMPPIDASNVPPEIGDVLDDEPTILNIEGI